MHAIILAAGNGGRLRPLTLDTPKPLVALNGRPLIAHVMHALAAAGADEITIIAGYRAAQVRDAVARIIVPGVAVDVIVNNDFAGGSATSLWAARGAVRGPFVLAMSDHVFDPQIVRRLVAHGRGCALAIERSAAGDARADEATLALVDSGRVTALGKGLREWNALDTGLFYCTPEVFDTMPRDMRAGEAGAVFAGLARRGELAAADVTGLRWIDIDTPEDLQAAAGMTLGDTAGRGEVEVA